MARSAPTPFARRNETALIWTAEFKAFSGVAGAITTPMAVQQGKDWDLIMPKVLPTPTGPMAYTKAEIDDMFVNRGARTVPLMIVGYGNDGPVAITDEPPTQAPPYGVVGGYGSRVHWDPEWYLYDVPF